MNAIALMLWSFAMGFCSFFWASRALITRDMGDGVAAVLCVVLACMGAAAAYFWA